MSRTGHYTGKGLDFCYIVLIGIMACTSIETAEDLGRAVRAARQACGLRLEDVAIAAGVGIRFVSELERGKPSVRLAETLRVLAAVGVRISAEDTR
jgi:HTH-type transcriptional regulator/antitoxin HipB